MPVPALVSQRTAAAVLAAAGQCTEPQSRLLMHAHVCGPGWPLVETPDQDTLAAILAASPDDLASTPPGSTLERESRVWALTDVVALAQRPRLAVDDLAAALPGDLAVVVRQIARRDLQPGPSAENPVNRPYYGVDATVARSEDDTAQRDASRMLWRLSPTRRDRITASITTHGAVPLLVSCGGYLVTGWDIVGFDHDTTRGLDTIAFALAPGAPTWRTNIADRWFNSGPGQALALLNTSTSTHNSPTESPITTAAHRPRTLTA